MFLVLESVCMKIRNLNAVVIALILVGCAAPVEKVEVPKTPETIASATIVKRDDFKKLTEYKGMDLAPTDRSALFLRAWKGDTGEIKYQIYVNDWYFRGGWRLYDSAYDSNGNKLDVSLISRDVNECKDGQCDYNEHLGLNISRKYLEDNQETGIKFKLTGKGGEDIEFLPSVYIKGFLLSIH